VWYFGNKWHLFVRGGVFQCPGDLLDGIFRRYTWAFVDADDELHGNSLVVAAQVKQLFIILSTSPQPARWKLLQKNTSCASLKMNPWSWAEIQEA
jgi:hypothetical protein